MGAAGAVLVSLLLLACAGDPAARAAASLVPSLALLASCPTTCGDLTFKYPFGIGTGCFRDPDFALICNHTMQPPRLFLNDGVTEVVESIDADNGNAVHINFSRSILPRPGSNVYNLSWEVPGSSFTAYGIDLTITGCDFDVYLLEGHRSKFCAVSCPATGIANTVATNKPCNGDGCCHVRFPFGQAFQLQFVWHHNPSSQQNRIDVKYTHDDMVLDWGIVDQLKCPGQASAARTNYACVSNHSYCFENGRLLYPAYLCFCDEGYAGNPYMSDGCSPDDQAQYNPFPRKQNCRTSCGNISVPFPFGLEEGCAASREFQLSCSDSSGLCSLSGRQVSYIDINEGAVNLTDKLSSSMGPTEQNHFYTSSITSKGLNWVVANLSCQDAEKSSTYACVSINSICDSVNSDNSDGDGIIGYIGYRCKCKPGFDGNPYIRNGCSHSRHSHTLLLGILIGLGVGFGILSILLSAIFFDRRWRKDAEKKLRKKYFKENQGLLLQQLISSDERASDKTKIFSLEELEKATNNFDHTRILGRGGHGMVYKGILSDQRVVAIKKSKVIKQSEIKEFINEVAILSQINHRNIVKLFGCCLETKVPLLVYDFVPNGSLFQILHSSSDNNFRLSWDDCLRIATEAAGALYYLHSAASISVFHRDVKSENILLDANYTAKVSDFGASRLVPVDDTHIITVAQGTFGYFDPEYHHTGQLNEKSDVYSFGVVLLELLLKRKPIFTSDSGSTQSLSNYFLWELKSRPIIEIVPAQVREEATVEEINSVASLAETCLRLRGEERPTMREVDMTLQALRMKRLRSCQIVAGNDQEIHPLLYPRAKPCAGQSLATYVGDTLDQPSQRCFSLEQEFMSSAELPR